tara:strand:+ start:1127 stop:1726 length:600 start_codon:yes stop_codon:yes gene_type:complete
MNNDFFIIDSKTLFFEDIYKNNKWGGQNSRSGTGSEGAPALQKCDLLNNIIEQLNIESILDIGCGDLYWMKDVLHKNPNINYTGVDVVKDLLDTNKTNNPKHTFELLNFKKLYKADLVVVFDVFGHQLHNEVIELINYINKLDVKYVIVTNRINDSTKTINVDKHRHEGINVDIYNEWKKELIFKTDALFPQDYFCLYK